MRKLKKSRLKLYTILFITWFIASQILSIVLMDIPISSETLVDGLITTVVLEIIYIFFDTDKYEK